MIASGVGGGASRCQGPRRVLAFSVVPRRSQAETPLKTAQNTFEIRTTSMGEALRIPVDSPEWPIVFSACLSGGQFSEERNVTAKHAKNAEELGMFTARARMTRAFGSEDLGPAAPLA